MKTIMIQDKGINTDRPPFIVAEMSGNHNKSLDRAIAIVEAAAKAGCDAVKLQTYTPDTMTLNLKEREFFIQDPKSLWKGDSLYAMYERAYLPWQWHKPIFERCKQLGIIGFSTPFDATAVDFLETLNVPCYKIASFELVDIPLIRKVALTAKPVILSTGIASLEEINDAIDCIKDCGNNEIILLKCTSSYPADPRDSHIRSIDDMQKRFNCLAGISDHTLGIGVAVGSISFGACVIEKHFTLSHNDAGVDSVFSLEPQEMQSLVEESRRAWQALGDVRYGPTDKEKESLVFRRSIYITQDMKKGECFTEANLKVIRPGIGLPPKYYYTLLGKKINRDVKRGTSLSWELIEDA